ncbi:hypothetical protein B5G52_12380 [Pseudoalteromonas sp. A601]|uniref:hypothetical protein n=1 Tax=Pseudoalteromonas sp. A601 TaxID=1967839 RepID=UPI000B3D3A89|nr:hypothetical protein [Pseudoalteromonas sp. A601]OUS70995.1 hypothetical protein B5G52_12380 [Pseudoalteromonas sp. A601]
MTVKQALVFESLINDITLDEGKEIIEKIFKANSQQINAFFEKLPVFRASYQRAKDYQHILRQKGIITTLTTPNTSPNSVTIEQLYKIMLELKKGQEIIESKLEEQNKTINSMKIRSFPETSKSLGQALDSIKIPSSESITGKMMENLSPAKLKVKPFKLSYPKKSIEFNWWALLFGASYVCGYGKLKKGICLAAISGVLPLFAVIVALYCGFTANRTLPVKQAPFNWRHVALSVTTSLITALFSYGLIKQLSS